MASGQSYPSPNAAQVGSGAGPFYDQNGRASSPSQDVPDDLKLVANEIRNPAPIAPMMSDQSHNGAAEQHQQHLQYQAQPAHPDHLQVSTPTRGDLSQNHMAHEMLNLAQQHGYGATPQHEHHDASMRKRSKVSRACDECRRKKIRCDATSENGPEACSSCKRTGARCCFSRAPMKRGPSKGYIKELADRLSQLEQRDQHGIHSGSASLQSTAEALLNQGISDVNALAEHPGLAQLQNYSPPVPSPFNRKRTHSASEGHPGSFETPMRGGWQPNEFAKGETYSYQSSPQVNDPYAYQARRESLGAFSMDGVENTAAELAPEVIEEYYRIIHPTLPLLPTNKSNLLSSVAASPAPFRDAFRSALECAVRENPASSLFMDKSARPNYEEAAHRILSFELEDKSQWPLTTHLLYLQSLILLSLHRTSSLGPAGLSGMDWLTPACAAANKLQLYFVENPAALRQQGDLDGEHKLKRRIYWVLFILDRFQACSTAGSCRLPDTGAILMPEDREYLGDPTYQLAHIASILGNLSASFTFLNAQSVGAATTFSTDHLQHLIGMWAQSALNRLRGGIVPANPLIQAFMLHTRLLLTRLFPLSAPGDVLSGTINLVNLLGTSDLPITPLNHHLVAMAYLSLAELADSGIPDFRLPVTQAFDELENAFRSGHALALRDDSQGWETALRELIAKKKAHLQSGAPPPMMGLQHLADAAVGSERSAAGTGGINEDGRPGSATGAGANVASSVAAAAQAAASAAAASVAQATAAAAQAQMAPGFDAVALARYGYLVLAAKAWATLGPGSA